MAKELNLTVENGIVTYEPFGSYYCLKNGELYQQPMSQAKESKPHLDMDEWAYIDFELLVDEEEDADNLLIEANILRRIWQCLLDSLGVSWNKEDEPCYKCGALERLYDIDGEPIFCKECLAGM